MLLGWPAGGPAGALVRWDPVGHAERELTERRQLGLPPAWKAVVVGGDRFALEGIAESLVGRQGIRLLGPENQDPSRLIVLIGQVQVQEVIDELKNRAMVLRAGNRSGVRLQVDGPID